MIKRLLSSLSLLIILTSGLSSQDMCDRIDILRKSNNYDIFKDSVEHYIKHIPFEDIDIPTWDVIYYSNVNSHFQIGKYKEAINLGKQYLNWQKSVNYQYNEGDLFNVIGTSYHMSNNLDSAAVYYIRSADTNYKNGNKFYYAIIMNNLGVIYLNSADYTKSIEYYKNTRRTFNELKDSTYMSSILGNIAAAYDGMQQLDSAKHYAEMAIYTGERMNTSKGVFNGKMTLAAIAKYDKDTTNAIRINKEVYKQAIDEANDEYKHRAGQALAPLVSDKKEALKLAEEAYEYSQTYALGLEDSFQATLAHLYRKNEQSEKGYDLLYELQIKKDSVNKSNYEEERIALIAKFESKEKELKIAEQEQAISKKDVENTQLIGGLLLSGLLGLSALFFVFQNRRINQQKLNVLNEKNEKRFAQLETMILKAQMNPHFMFNSLNSIRYLFMKDQKDKGLKYITKFAKLLRSTLNHGEKALVKLSEEIELTELYIQLEQLRFEDQFEYQSIFSEDDAWKEISIPPFVIQPIVENAFWHGLSASEKTLKSINITIVKDENQCLIHIDDNGVGMNNSKSSTDASVGKEKSYGLSLIKERFDLMNTSSENQYSMSISTPQQFDSGSRVSIRISPKN